MMIAFKPALSVKLFKKLGQSGQHNLCGEIKGGTYVLNSCNIKRQRGGILVKDEYLWLLFMCF